MVNHKKRCVLINYFIVKRELSYSFGIILKEKCCLVEKKSPEPLPSTLKIMSSITQTECRAQPQTCGIELNDIFDFKLKISFYLYYLKDFFILSKKRESITQPECRAQPQTCGVELNFFGNFKLKISFYFYCLKEFSI